MVSWDKIDTVLLDMDGTLLDLHFDNYFWLEYLPQVYSTTFSLPENEAIDFLHQRFAKEQGTISWYCLDYWSEELQLDIANLKRDVEAKIAVRPFVEEFLMALRQHQKQIVLVTNAHRDSLDLKMEKTQLSCFFDQMISSHDYGVPKEDVTLWESVKADCHFLPERALLIDDAESVLNAAKSFGIGHLLTIYQPDSQRPIREQLCYPAIHHFDEIMP